jgi:hypothetical protein
MPATFAVDLCGFRAAGQPNTSDANDKQSVEWGNALFVRLGVAPGTPEPGDIGNLLEERVVADLQPRRPDLFIQRSQVAANFTQYAQLALVRRLRENVTEKAPALMAALEKDVASLPPERRLARVRARVAALSEQLAADREVLTEFLRDFTDESLLKVDIGVGDLDPPRQLLIALSSKWSLRTDRAQDCVSQGNKLVSLRRGRAPHFAVVTMEPRSSMLRILADGSSVDCVYHMDLPALRASAEDEERRKQQAPTRALRGSWKPRVALERMVAQGRIRDYDDLVREVMLLPSGQPAP